MRIGDMEMPSGAALGPMAGVTDAPMRLLCAQMGCAWTVSEMLSAKGFLYSPENHAHTELLHRFEGECAGGLQLFGSEEAMLSEAAKRLENRGFSFFDLNFGCPAHKIVQNGEGSALMRDPAKIGRLVYAVARATRLPVTVKIRAGWDAEHVNAVEVARVCEENGARAIAVHPRLRDQFYAGKSDWSLIRLVKQAVHVPVIGNGDVFSGADAIRMRAETGCDAVMIARGAQGNPWIFREVRQALAGEPIKKPTVAERVNMALRHLNMQCDWRGERYAVPEMRKHIAWYLAGTPGSQRLRASVNTMTTRGEVCAALNQYLNTYGTEE